jgi:hypothetical protein
LSDPEPAGASRARHFPCPSCGADLVWAPARGLLRCEYCGYERHDERRAGSVAAAAPAIPAPPAFVAEMPLAERLAARADLDWGASRRSVRCAKCGAAETFDAGVAAKSCAFCGSPAVAEAPAESGALRPDGVLPFRVEKRAAIESFRGWLRSLWFRPTALKVRAALTEIRGVYIPFWTFDARSESDWSAEAGTRHRRGKTTTISWRHVSGHLSHRFDDLPLPASRGLDAATAREIEPFPTAELLPFEPGYLSGFLAEELATGVAEARAAAEARMDELLRAACRAQFRADVVRNLRVSTTYSAWTTKSGLLPIWIAAYEFGGESYRYVVNGATGKATGTAPWSWVKIGLAALAALVVLLLIAGNR